MFFKNGQLTEPAKKGTLGAMKLTLASEAEPEHLLIAMLENQDSALSRSCQRVRPRLKLESLHGMVVTAARKRNGQMLTGNQWSDALISERSAAVISQAIQSEQWKQTGEQKRERILVADFLDSAMPRVKRLFDNMGAEVSEVTEFLRRSRSRSELAEPFDPTGNLDKKAFGQSGRAIWNSVESEGKGLGLDRIGTPLFLFALLSRSGGAMERAIRIQAVDPKSAHENLLLQLRSLGKKRFQDKLRLSKTFMQPVIVETVEAAAELARELDLAQIGEAELIRGLFRQNDLFLRSFFGGLKIDFEQLSSYIGQMHSGQEDESEEDHSTATIEEIEQRLRKRVVGQDHVIDVVIPILKRMRFGYPRLNRPMAVLLFLGNSGTGKTQLAKEIARAMYGSEDQMIFLEMGQFGTEYSKNTFVGAPPGYVGYGEGLLTNGLRDKPESVVLFDEVEKAHKSVFDVLLRFLDEGQIADPAGPVRDGSRCIIILTSNHALDMLQELINKQTEAKGLPLAQRHRARQEVRNAILATNFFRPEFINRVDELLLFNRFDTHSYKRIIEYLFETEASRIKELKDIDVHFDEALVSELVDQCLARFDEGARVCGKLVDENIVGSIIDFCLTPGNEDVRQISIGVDASKSVRVRENQ